MKNERQIAEIIFDKFIASKSKSGEIIMFRVIQHTLIDKLNPKERELFEIVFNGLILTGYFTYEKDSPECIRLTEKGYDYIYDDNKIATMLQKPWIIPNPNKPDWDKAFFKLWKVIGPKDSATYYLKGSHFYSFIMELCDDIPPSYTKYIDFRTDKELSTTRVDYYKDLIDHLDEEKRIELYVNIQANIEDDLEAEEHLEESIIFESLISEVTAPEIAAQPVSSISPAASVVSENKQPIVFISYSWDSKAHEDWVIKLATQLLDNGVDVILDKWDLGPLGKPLPHFMENSISKSNRVICIMTPNYKIKADNPVGGVGYEYSMITAEIFAKIDTSKFIPLFKEGTDENAIPTALKSRKYVDMRDETQFEEKFKEELLRDIHNEPLYVKPPIGKKPSFGK